MSRLFKVLCSSKGSCYLRQTNNSIGGGFLPKVRWVTSVSEIKNKFEALNRKSTEFFDKQAKFDSERKTNEITRLIQQWSTLWNKESSASDLSQYLHDKSEKEALETGVQVVDRLANILLDVRENHVLNSGGQDDRTQYLYAVNLAIAFWGKCPPSQLNGVRAQHLLSRMEQVGVLDFSQMQIPAAAAAAGGGENADPAVIAYGAAIQAWAISSDPRDSSINGALEAQALLEKLEAMSNSSNGASNERFQPQLRIYNSCIHGFAIRGMIDEAEAMLEKLEKMSETTPKLTPDVLTFSSCINAYLKSTKARGNRGGGKPLAKRAEALLDRMVKRYEATGGDVQYRPNQTTFGTVISLFAKSNTRTAAEDADRILQWLISLYEKDINSGSVQQNQENDSFSLQPTYVHFISVLLAYQRRTLGRAVAIKRIEELLFQMDAMYEAGNDKVKPTYQCFVIYLNALAKSGEAEKAERVLSRIENLLAEEESFEINNYGYNLVMDAWAKSRKRGRAVRAEAVLNRMHDLAVETGNKSLMPDKFSYTCLLNAIFNDKEGGYIERCEEVIHIMETGDDRMRPDVFSYNYLIKAYVSARMLAKAEDVISRIENSGLKPSVINYNNVMNAYSKDRAPGSSENVIRIFEEIQSKSYLTPDIKSYVMCIDALARSKRTSRVQIAENLVDRYIQYAKRNQSHEDAAPIFYALQTVYIQSDSFDKARKSLSVVKLMEDNGIRPGVRAYNGVIKACSRISPDADLETKRSTVEIAARVLHVLQNSEELNPDSITYNDLISLCKLISDAEEKSLTIRALFKQCCNGGVLNRSILATLKEVAGNDFWILVGRDRGHVDITSLDPKWSRNVRISPRR